MEEFCRNSQEQYQEILAKTNEEIDALNPLVQEFKEYFEHLDDVLLDTNENQENILKKKYRFFLTKLKKLEEVQKSLQHKLQNLGDYVDNSIAIREQIKSIAFIEMISAETLKKLQILGKEVQQAREIKRRNEKSIVELKGKINKLKSTFFQLKKEQVTLLNEFRTQKQENLLNLADKKFKKIIKQKMEDKIKQTNNNLKKLANAQNNMRHSQGFDAFKKTQKASKSTSNFYPSSKKCILTTLDQVNSMKQSLMTEVEQLQENKNNCMKNRYQQLINNWDAKFKTNGIKWWMDKIKYRKNFGKQQENLLKINSDFKQRNLMGAKKTIGDRKYEKIDCKGCTKRQQQILVKDKLKFQLVSKERNQVVSHISQQKTQKLLIDEVQITKLSEQQQKKKQAFLQLSPLDIIKLVSKKNKIYELSKLIQTNFGKKIEQSRRIHPSKSKSKNTLRC